MNKLAKSLYIQGMVSGAAVMALGGIEPVLSFVQKNNTWLDIDQSDIDILIEEYGIEVLRKYGYQK